MNQNRKKKKEQSQELAKKQTTRLDTNSLDPRTHACGVFVLGYAWTSKF